MDSAICKKLYSTYDSEFLKNIPSKEIKKTFLQISKKFKDGENGNTVLMNLIYNTFKGEIPIVKYVSGPMSITYQTSSKYDKKIYILGEYHGTAKQCSQIRQAKNKYMDITTYLDKLFKNTDKFIDFYLEDELFREMKPLKTNFIHRIRYFFDDCLNPKKRHLCEYKTIRTHFVDSRRIGKGSYIKSSNPIESLITAYKNNLSLNEHKDTLKTLSSLKSHENIADYIINVAVNIPVLLKELKKSELSLEFIIKTFREIIIKKYKETFKIKKWKSVKWGNKKKVNMDLLIMIQSPIVDMYTISRMFKRFEKTKYSPSKPRHIIYYAGDYHSAITREFLNTLGFNLKITRYMNLDNWTRCLDMKGIILDFK